MSLKEILKRTDMLYARVGSNGLYVVDEDLVCIFTDWERMPFWGHFGRAVAEAQEGSEGVDVAALVQGDRVLSNGFPSLHDIDHRIRKGYREKRKDLMAKYHAEQVIIHLLPVGDYIVFTCPDEEIYIHQPYIRLLDALGAHIMEPTQKEEQISVSAAPHMVGYLRKIEPPIEVDEGANLDEGECREALAHFDTYYDKKRRTPGFHNNPLAQQEVQSELVETLMQITGYEKNHDPQLNEEVERRILEVMPPQLVFQKAVSFPVAGTEFFENAHPDRIQRIEIDGNSRYVFVADWDKGYADTLGSYIPIGREAVVHLKKRLPDLPVKNARG